MQPFDISSSLDPVINLSTEDTQSALFLAATSSRVRITIENIPPSAPVAIPVRIIEGMETILERRVVSHSQYGLICRLFDLLNTKPLAKA